MNKVEAIVRLWFEKWEVGDIHGLPLTEDFTHTSPFGVIPTKKDYLELVEANKDKFLGYHFEIHDLICENDKACVRYTAKQGVDFSLEVSEWYYLKDNLIEKIISHYHIGEIQEERKLKES